MLNIIHLTFALIFFQCFCQSFKGIINEKSTSNFYLVEANRIKKEDVQQADLYIAEVSDDIKTRLYQILNNDITYTRQSIDLIDKDDIATQIKKRNFISVLDPDYQSKLRKERNEKHYTSNSNLDLEVDPMDTDPNEPIMENYTPYLNKKGKHKDSSPSIPIVVHENQNQNIYSHGYENNQNQNQNQNESENTYSNDQIQSQESVSSNESPLPSPSVSNQNPYQNDRRGKDRMNSTNCNKNGRYGGCKSSSTFYHSINVEESELSNNRNDTFSQMTTVQPFDFSVECMDDEDECYYINDRLENAGTYISNIFNIYETIKVEVHILPFCKHMGGDNCKSITALTYAPSFVTLNVTGQGIYSYPQALVKQLEVNDRIQNYASYDISLYFNTDYLKEHNYGNYLLVATHEIIHGMGFFHLMTTASAAFKMNFPEDRIIPQPLAHSYRTSQGEEKAYQGWIPFTVFDRYIVEVEHPEFYIHQGIQDYLEDVQAHKLLSEEALIDHFENLDISPPAHAYSKSLVSSFKTREAIGFRTYDGEVVTLQTFDEYESMSSISHIHAPFSCKSAINCYVPKEKLNEVDDNYLMYYTIITRPVNELVKRYSSQSSHGFIGEKIIKIMKTLGWTEKQDLTYFREYQNMILTREAHLTSGTTFTPTSRLSFCFPLLLVFGSFLFNYFLLL